MCRRTASAESIRKAQAARRNAGVARRLIGAGDHTPSVFTCPCGARRGKRDLVCTVCRRIASGPAGFARQPCAPLIRGTLGHQKRSRLLATLEAYAKAHRDEGPSVREVLAALRLLDAASVADFNPGKPLRPQLRTVPKPAGAAHRVFSLVWPFGRRKGKSDLFCADCGRKGITPKYMQAQPCTRIAAGALGSGRRRTLLTELAALPRATSAAHKRLATALRALLALAPPHAPTAARTPMRSRRDARYALRGERLGEARQLARASEP